MVHRFIVLQKGIKGFAFEFPTDYSFHKSWASLEFNWNLPNQANKNGNCIYDNIFKGVQFYLLQNHRKNKNV